MHGAKCKLCGRFWAFSSGPVENFMCITHWCPECISKMPGWGKK